MNLIGTIIVIIFAVALLIGCISELKHRFTEDLVPLTEEEPAPDITPLTQVIDAISEKQIEDVREEYRFETTNDKIDYIRETAEQFGVDPDIALRIARCESYDSIINTCHCDSGTPYQNNCVENCSKGIGIYKILQSTFDETLERMKKDSWLIWNKEHQDWYSPHKIEQNVFVALWLMSQDEYWRWNQSKHCWGN